MSASTTREDRASRNGDGRSDSGLPDPATVVELLADDDAVRLFRAATKPKPVSTLAEESELPLSTTYRKVEKLEAAGLLRRVTPYSSGGTPPAQYERSVEAVSVTLDGDLTVRVRRTEA
ncbi:helix-turn-helix domain-containing protein [Halostella litorea]|uniref:helix-turn-helix domain-containing protein n=1 Tax=Halostella litorea TaxID=2528831 RepID=UPI001386B4A0|nr:helix-turn-helix domain-containing protein [Halostella litorea]